MAKGINGVTVVSVERLQLFKQLQDALNQSLFLGIHATADNAKKLETPVTIDGISFDGSANITLPTKVVQVYSADVEVPVNPEEPEGDKTTVKKYYSDSEKTVEVTTFDTAKLYVDLTTNEHKHFNGTTLVAAAAADNIERIPMSMKGAAGGVAELDANGTVPADQLPSYVDDIIDIIVETTTDDSDPDNVVTTTTYYYATAAGTKGEELTVAKMEKGKIYIDINATIDGSYRFSGSTLVKIGNSVSTADRAINDVDGNPIKTTYVKVRENYDLMSNTQAQQLQTLVDATYEESSDADIRSMFDAATLAAYDQANPTFTISTNSGSVAVSGQTTFTATVASTVTLTAASLDSETATVSTSTEASGDNTVYTFIVEGVAEGDTTIRVSNSANVNDRRDYAITVTAA